MLFYAVIDTNVVVASLLTRRHDSPTVRIMDAVYSGTVVPLLDDEMAAEYREVLRRKKFGFDQAKCDFIVSLVIDLGISLDRMRFDCEMPDEKDRVFFEIALAGRDVYDSRLVTGNQKHYPKADFVVNPAQFCELAGI